MPALNLTIVTHQGRPCPPENRRLDGGRLTIGRGEESGWELPNPERDLSRVHCVVERVGDGYTITDTSTNGVYLNGASEPLGRNVSAPLGDRDEIAIGPYRIRAELDAAVESGPAPDPFAVVPPGSNLSWFPPTAAASDPLVAAGNGGLPPWPELAANGADPFGPAGGPQPASDFAWPTADPFPADPSPPPRGVEIPADFGWPPADPFATGQPPMPAAPDARADRAPDPDHVSAIDAHFRPPPLQAPQIPPGWDPLREDAFPATPKAEALPPQPEPKPAAVAPPRVVPAAMPAARTAPVAAPERVAPVGGTDAATAAQALRALLDGLGISDLPLPPGDELLRLRAVGALFREMAAGLRDLANARTITKAGLHVAQTAIAARDNNPFKFSVDLDQLLAALLVPRRPAYKEPLAAIRETVDDLKAHDLALIAAMQAAVGRLLAGLAPDAVAQSGEAAGMIGNLLPATRKAGWWDAYVEIYRHAVEGVEADLPGGFRADFADAYREQTEKF